MANIAHYKKIIEQRTAAKEVASILTTKAAEALEHTVAKELTESTEINEVEQKQAIEENEIKLKKTPAKTKGATIMTKFAAGNGDEFQ